MNISKIINKCNYGSSFDTDNVDIYKNTGLSQSINYFGDEINTCLDLQTIQNLFSGIESNGSSYKYTLNIPNLNNNVLELFKSNNEYFQYGEKYSTDSILSIFDVFSFCTMLIIILFFLKKVNLIKIN